MRARLILVLAFGFLFGAGPVPVHATSGTIEMEAGFAKSIDDANGTGDTFGGGISFGGGFWYDASEMIAVGGEISYDDMGSVNYYNNYTVDNEASIHVLRVNPAIRINSAKREASSSFFFFQGGAGLYNATAKVKDTFFDFELQNTDAKFGIHGGLGASFGFGPKTRLVFTGLYHNVFLDGEALNYFHLRGGIGFLI